MVRISPMENRMTAHIRFMEEVEKEYRYGKITAEQAFLQIKEKTKRFLQTEMNLDYINRQTWKREEPPTAAEIEENKKRLPWLQRDYSKWEKEGESNP